MKKLFILFAFGLLPIISFSWTTPERLTYLNDFTELSGNGAKNIAVDREGRVHVVFYSEALVPGFNSTPQVWYKRYEPNIGWTKDTCIADVANEASEMPALCCDSSGNLHIVYIGYTLSSYNLRYKNWNPTTGWTSSVIISTNTREKNNPSITATTNGNIHCVWTEMRADGYYKIFYRERIGSNWPSPPVEISSISETEEELPSISAGRGDSIYVVWRGENPVNYYYNIFYRARINGSWQSILYVCSFNSDQCDWEPYGPSISVDNANVGHISWYGWNRWDEYYGRVYYRRRLAAGFSTIDTIAGAGQPDDFERYGPQVAIDRQGNTHVVWFGEDYWTDAWFRLWHKKRTSAGWLATEELACEYPEGDLYNPHIASDTLGLHLVWFDDRLEDEEIFWMVSYPQDVEIKAIVSPPVFCTLASYIPKVVIRNSGEEEILNPFNVKITINPGGYEDIVNVSYLGVGAEETLEFNSWLPTQADLYTVKCSLLVSDHFLPNNKKSRYCGIPNFLENFEVTNGRFTSEPAINAWEWGTPSLVGPPNAHSGAKCFGTNIDGNYANNANWKLNSFWYVATKDTPVLGFYHWYRFQTRYDGGNVKFSKDGINFSLLHSFFPEPYDRKLDSGNVGIPQESAYSRGVINPIGWTAVLMPIPVAAGDTFVIRWHFGSDGSFNYPGWYLDDVGGVGFEPLRHDVGVVEIVSPADTVDSSIPINPQVKVKNFGTQGETFNATLKIESYLETKTIALLPAQESTVTFSPWTPMARGVSFARCSLYLASDENRINDTLTKSFFIRVKDVGVLDLGKSKISSCPIPKEAGKFPFGEKEVALSELANQQINFYSLTFLPDTLDSGDLYTPEAWVKNFGNTQVTFWTRFSFGNFYSESLLTTLLPDSESHLTFSSFTVPGRGPVVKKCSTLLLGDLIPDNNCKKETTFVRVRDIGIVRFLSPTPFIYPGPITPQVLIANCGNVGNGMSLFLKIEDSLNNIVYTAETTHSYLPAGCSLSFAFPSWQATVGQYVIACSLSASGDRVFANDTSSLAFTVGGVSGWIKKADLVGGRKNVKSGGCIAAFDSLVYALVGNNTRDFLCYSITGNIWRKVESIPTGSRGKKVKKGACISSDGDYIYALKGGGTNEFYRYDPALNRWESLPAPSFIKGIKGGFITFVERSGIKYLYCGSGTNSNEWKRFNINTSTWEDLPIPLPKEKFKVGSGFAYDGDSLIYLTQGGSKYNAFFLLNFNYGDLTWESLPNLPLVGRSARKKKIKEGAALVYSQRNRKIYATKGGNTLEFWRFDPINRRWEQAEDVGSPEVPYKKIKGGGSLAYSHYASGIFATIGNNTNEFWFYAVPATTSLPISYFSGEVKNQPLIYKGEMSSVAIRKKDELEKIKIYNLLGEVVLEDKGEKKTLDFSQRLPTGIYILKIEGKGKTETKKIIIMR